jgi:hypothetical protein
VISWVKVAKNVGYTTKVPHWLEMGRIIGI